MPFVILAKIFKYIYLSIYPTFFLFILPPCNKVNIFLLGVKGKSTRCHGHWSHVVAPSGLLVTGGQRCAHKAQNQYIARAAQHSVFTVTWPVTAQSKMLYPRGAVAGLATAMAKPPGRSPIADCLAVYIYVYNMVRQLYIGLPFPGHSCLLLPWLAVKIKYLYLTRFSLLNVIIKGYFLFWNVNKLIYIAGCFIMLSFIFGRIHKLKQRGQCLAY